MTPAIQEVQRFTFINDAYIPEPDLLAPTPVASPVKSSPMKKGGRKRKQSENDTLSSPKPVAPKRKKKSASKTAIFDIDDDKEVAEPPQSITAHLHLKTSIEVVNCTRGKSVTSTSTKFTQCPPFIFMVKDNFDTFIDAVAEAAQTVSWHLTTSRLRWCFETPANLQLKLLTNEVGYTAMINAVKARRKDQSVFLYIPQPVSNEQVRCLKYNFIY